MLPEIFCSQGLVGDNRGKFDFIGFGINLGTDDQ